MAVGDIVSGLSKTGDLTFQPAVGVEICITDYGAWSNAGCITDGTTTALTRNSLSAATVPLSTKLMINNTIYLKILVDAASGCHYTGIQTQ